MRDLRSNILAVEAIAPAVLAADNVPAAIDLRDFGQALLVLSIGAGGIAFTAANRIDFVLTHSDDDQTYTAVTDADISGVTGTANGIIKSLTAASPASTVDRVGYIGGKRYLKLLADFSGTHPTGTAISAVVIKGAPTILPLA